MDTSSGFQHSFKISPDQLLAGNEVIALVDDDQAVRSLIKIYFEEHGLPVVEADCGASFIDIIKNNHVALALLDIGLPDTNGTSLLLNLKKNHPDIAVLMLTGIADLETALDCLRSGADDYLAKPVQLNEIFNSTTKILEKRRLILQNQQYQEDLEKANFRLQLMHQLSVKMNTAYLNTIELDEILQAILVGITANEGLRFNRAFLAMFDNDRKILRGKMAIGPACHEEASVIWSELGQRQLGFLEIINELKSCKQDTEVSNMIKSLEVPVSNRNHILIRAANDKKSIKVTNNMTNGYDAAEISNFLGTDSYVVVPLYSPRRPLGVIIVDNFITRHPISDSYVSALELFSSQASLAIEHSHLYTDMKKTIAELESVNYELDKNKNLLVEAERYSVLGQMASQMVHNLRNPITSIGGVARIMAKKATDKGLDAYITVMEKETSRLESILKDLFDFVSKTEIKKEICQIYPLIRKSLMLLKTDTTRQNITVELNVAQPDIELNIDRSQIRKMLVHLLKNGVEAMPGGGRLTIKVVQVNAMVHIHITDSGHSISDDLIKRAREPFFTTKTYGTGMGLATVDLITAAHNGNFTMQKTASGTEIIVRLPK